MFLEKQNKDKIDYYKDMLGVIGSLSRLFSESNEPYIHYRIAENLFCGAFSADNLSRQDYSVDASKNGIGIGIKTFLGKGGSSREKIAEFNSQHKLFEKLNPEKKIIKISELRNKRIAVTKRICGLSEVIYHCVTRKAERISIFEVPMESVDIDNITAISDRGNIIAFKDGKNDYSFNITKSTLYKKFEAKDILLDLSVKIFDDPFKLLEELLKKRMAQVVFAPIRKVNHIFLPLYSIKSGQVPDKSGLNQWNASGRPRDPNEIYIPIPAKIHEYYPKFFPQRDTAFTLILPDGKEMSAKLCQDNSKALMSNPNSDLGKWLLRDVLGLKERELLTYDKLLNYGLDSVVVYKIGENKYDIDFAKTGSYETFEASKKADAISDESDY